MMEANYTFGSMVRRGFEADASAEATVTVKVNGAPLPEHKVPMLIAGDVTGINPRQIIRSYPMDGVSDAEPNYLAHVEIDSPELPWMFSRPSPDGKLRPWISLAVIDVTEVARPEDDPLKKARLGYKLTTTADQLPDPAEADLWAHVQLLDSDTAPGDPTRSLARIVSPRKLEPSRRYLACLVPTLLSAREAGLDNGDAKRLSSDYAWDATGSASVELPVYHWFRFATGPAGDFEALVRRLRPMPLPVDMGRRRLRIDHAMAPPPPPNSSGADLELLVALRPPQGGAPLLPGTVGSAGKPISELTGQTYVDKLKSRLRDAGYDLSLLEKDSKRPPEVGPPVYGQLPVGKSATASALGSTSVPPWLNQLNLDPRNRVAAGLGAEVVRRNQDHYLELAWRQVGDVLAANRLRRRAEYSLGASRRLFDRSISKLDVGDLVTLTAPVHAKILVGDNMTVVGRLRVSPIPPAIASVEFRRFARLRGPLFHPADWQAKAGVEALTAQSSAQRPLVSKVPLDTIDRLVAPSTIFTPEESRVILKRLVSGIGNISATEAAEKLDKLAVQPQFEIPTLDAVRAATASHSLDVGSSLSAMGYIPTAILAEPREPDEPSRGRGAGVREGPRSGLGGLLRGVGAGLGGVIHRVATSVGLDALARATAPVTAATSLRPEASGAWARAAPSDLNFELARGDPAMVREVGGRREINLDRLSLAARTGKAATTIDRQTLDSAIAGRFEAPIAAPRDFRLDQGLESNLRSEITSAVETIAGRVIRPSDATQPERVALADGFSALRPLILDALDPEKTLPLAVNSRIAALSTAEQGSFDDVMAAPDLSEPTYLQLAAISQDWLLPGIDKLPSDSTSLVAANREFIEAFLVGMNHELSRELLWHEYPTDQRGTYARQFWSHRDSGTRAGQYDLVRELHNAADCSLEDLSGQPDDPLVLVVKGDLIHKYPGVIIFAGKTHKPSSRRALVEESIIFPDFFGLLQPDVALVGFGGLTEKAVREAAKLANKDEHFWFFFAEHFAEMRFGLDQKPGVAPSDWAGVGLSWNDAAWEHVNWSRRLHLGRSSFPPGSLPKSNDAAPAATKVGWAENSARQAWITLQFPFRRGVPAIDLLPKVVA